MGALRVGTGKVGPVPFDRVATSEAGGGRGHVGRCGGGGGGRGGRLGDAAAILAYHQFDQVLFLCKCDACILEIYLCSIETCASNGRQHLRPPLHPMVGRFWSGISSANSVPQFVSGRDDDRPSLASGFSQTERAKKGREEKRTPSQPN